MSRNGFFFMLFYGRVVNMTSMSIIFYFEQVNECWQLPTLVAKGFRHLNSPKSTLKNFYNALLGSMSTNVFFWVHEFENIDFLKEFWSKNLFFLKVFQVVQEGLGVFQSIFSVFWDSSEHISGWNWSCMWWRILVHLNKFEMDFPCERWRRILSTIFALLFKGKSKILTRGSCLTVS